MNLEPTLFKAYDIRGIYPSAINAEVIYNIGRAYATWLKKEDPEAKKICVGRDMRLSSPELQESLIKALTESGLDVDNLGLVSTPVFYYATASGGYHGGLQVSASHNPKEYNGVKVVRSGGVPVGGDTGLYEIKDIILSDSYMPLTDLEGIVHNKMGVTEECIADHLTHLEASNINRLKVVVDAANAMGALDAEALFGKLNCIVTKMNFELDGTFPAHEADPLKEENKVELKKVVLAEKADLGISLDGDGDRIFFVDELGQSVEQPIIRGLLAQIELAANPGATICYDIRPGKITEDMILEAGGVPSVTPVGHSLIKAQMLKVGAIFGGESSGHFFYKFPYGTFEASMLVAAKILEYISSQNKPFSEILAPFRNRYFQTGEINIHMSKREEILERIENIKETFKDGKINTVDGVYIEYPDAWFIVRASNTEPLMRIIVESGSEKTLEEYKNKILELVK